MSGSKMKIGLNAVCLDEKNSGLTEHFLNLVENILKLDSVNEYTIYFSKDYNFLKYEFFQKAKCVRTPLPAYNTLMRSVVGRFYWRKRTREDNIDIFHTSYFPVPGGLESKLVVTIHDLRHMKCATTSKLRYYYSRCILPGMMEKVRKVITVSDFIKDEIVDLLGVSEEKVRVIHNSYNSKFRKIEGREELDVKRRELFLPAHYILTVSRMEPRKNLEGLIRAFMSLKRGKDIEHKLVIVGVNEGDVAQSVKFDGDEVMFTGYVSPDDLPLIYNLADLFVFPSYYEGFGIPVLEAMACGTPVISSNTSAMPEVVGDAGVLFDPHRKEEIAETIFRVLSDESLRQQMILKGLERVKDFSWERAARETIRVYEEVGEGKWRKSSR